MKTKTNELIGPALDWAAAKCEFDELAAKNIQFPQYAAHYPKVSPSTDWAQGGPIIERERIVLLPDYSVGRTEFGTEYQDFQGWKAYRTDRPYWTTVPIHTAPTPLIAAMRCYVASKLGAVVDVPDELVDDKPTRR